VRLERVRPEHRTELRGGHVTLAQEFGVAPEPEDGTGASGPSWPAVDDEVDLVADVVAGEVDVYEGVVVDGSRPVGGGHRDRAVDELGEAPPGRVAETAHGDGAVAPEALVAHAAGARQDGVQRARPEPLGQRVDQGRLVVSPVQPPVVGVADEQRERFVRRSVLDLVGPTDGIGVPGVERQREVGVAGDDDDAAVADTLGRAVEGFVGRLQHRCGHRPPLRRIGVGCTVRVDPRAGGKCGATTSGTGTRASNDRTAFPAAARP